MQSTPTKPVNRSSLSFAASEIVSNTSARAPVSIPTAFEVADTDPLKRRAMQDPSDLFELHTQDSTPAKDEPQVLFSKIEEPIFDDFDGSQHSFSANEGQAPETSAFTEQTEYELVNNLKLSKKSHTAQSSLQQLLSKESDKQVPSEDLNALRDAIDKLEFKEDDEEERMKFDFDTQQGHDLAKNILRQVSELHAAAELPLEDRSYRLKFSQAYKALFEQNGGQESHSYLLEILCSAQENYPHLWVNGEKYVFSDDVTEAGDKLYKHFLDLREICPGNSRDLLAGFESAYSKYEAYYVHELMVIEKDARRFITEAVEAEDALTQIEAAVEKADRANDASTLEQLKQLENQATTNLIQKLAQINAVTNVSGSGRDDLTDLRILHAAEDIPRRLLVGQCQSIQVLADKIRQSYGCFRMLVRKYGQVLESVDPQLRNNPELLELCEVYEGSWLAGKDQLLDVERREELISFCLFIQAVSDEHPDFKEQVECCDAEIFVTIPSLLVLRALAPDESGQAHQRLVLRFCSRLQDKLKAMQAKRADVKEAAAVRAILKDENVDGALGDLVHSVKMAGVELSRERAADFNQFITAALNE